jgi:hypothetical protein
MTAPLTDPWAGDLPAYIAAAADVYDRLDARVVERDQQRARIEAADAEKDAALELTR